MNVSLVFPWDKLSDHQVWGVDTASPLRGVYLGVKWAEHETIFSRQKKKVLSSNDDTETGKVKVNNLQILSCLCFPRSPLLLFLPLPPRDSSPLRPH